MRSTPSLFKNKSLISDSARAEHNESNTFSMNSASSASVGSRRRNCYEYVRPLNEYYDCNIPRRRSRVSPPHPSSQARGDCAGSLATEWIVTRLNSYDSHHVFQIECGLTTKTEVLSSKPIVQLEVAGTQQSSQICPKCERSLGGLPPRLR